MLFFWGGGCNTPNKPGWLRNGDTAVVCALTTLVWGHSRVMFTQILSCVLCLIFFPADNNHRLNLFYLANDVIQNCKRKNAIVYRSSFADVLPHAIHLIKWVFGVCSTEAVLDVFVQYTWLLLYKKINVITLVLSFV